jgi:hypothetical protein
MFDRRRKQLLEGRIEIRMLVAVAFLLCASFSAIVHAATRSVEGLEFDTVVIWGSVEVEIRQRDRTELRYRGDSDDLEPEPFRLEDGSLHLGRNRSGERVKRVRYKLTVTDLRQLSLQGSGEVYIKPLTVEHLDISLPGSGEIKLYDVNVGNLTLRNVGSGEILAASVVSENLEVVLSGSGDIDLGEVRSDTVEVNLNGSGDISVDDDGETRKLKVNLVGSGDIDLAELRAADVLVNIIGSGDASVWADESLNVSILGSGDVDHRGNAEPDVSVLGSGEVVRRD